MLKGTPKTPDPDPIYRRHSIKNGVETTTSLTLRSVSALIVLGLGIYCVLSGQAEIGLLIGFVRSLWLR